MSNDTLPTSSELGMPIVGKRRAAVNWFNERVYSGEYQIIPITTCFCGSTNFEQLSRFDRYGLPFGTQICVDCGLISQTRHLAEEAMKSFYNDIYWDLIAGDNPVSFKTPQASLEPFLSMLAPYLGPNVRHVVDLGCGAGERLALLAAGITPRPRLVGCDYSLTALEHARSKGIDARFGGFETLKGRDKADILILSHIIEHLVDLKSALSDIRDVTHENTIVYVEVPGVMDLLNKREYGYDYQDYSVVAHIHSFSLGTLARVFDSAGFGLVAGDEYVRAVFRRNYAAAKPITESSYRRTRRALKEAEQKSATFRKRILPRVRAGLRAAYSELSK